MNPEPIAQEEFSGLDLLETMAEIDGDWKVDSSFSEDPQLRIKTMSRETLERELVDMQYSEMVVRNVLDTRTKPKKKKLLGNTDKKKGFDWGALGFATLMSIVPLLAGPGAVWYVNYQRHNNLVTDNQSGSRVMSKVDGPFEYTSVYHKKKETVILKANLMTHALTKITYLRKEREISKVNVRPSAFAPMEYYDNETLTPEILAKANKIYQEEKDRFQLSP